MNRPHSHAECFAELNKGWNPGDPIGYIRQDIPKVELPPYRGQRYEATVPDTLDLASGPDWPSTRSRNARTLEPTTRFIRYTLVRKGNDVVSIEPPGRHCPLYQRHHYRSNEALWRKVTRIVSDGSVET